MASPQQRKLIIILSAVLLAAIAASVAVLVLLPGRPGPATPQTPQDTPAASSGFNMRVLQRSAYQALNATLIQSGLLPVRPPANAGKANPFL